MIGAVLALPYRRPPLSLNDRPPATKGAVYARAAKIAELRRAVYALAHAANLPRGLPHVTVQLHYRPRDNRVRDADNLVATAKPCYDALAGGSRKTPGYGLVADDDPTRMTKPTPVIHPAEKGQPGALWLEITWGDGA